MSEKELKKNMKRIEELVFDENQIVTCKLLSRLLDVHVNAAKQLLQSFLSTHEKSCREGISATYQISGLKDGVQYLKLVNEGDLAIARTSLDEVWSEHVYSLQKMKTVDDFQLLYTAEPLDSTNILRSYPITCSESVEKSETELTAQRRIFAPPEEDPRKSKSTSRPPLGLVNNSKSPKKPAKSLKKDENEKEACDNSIKEVTKKITNVKIESSKGNPAPKKGASIKSMFSAQNLKPRVVEKKTEKFEKETPKEVAGDDKKEKMDDEDKPKDRSHEAVRFKKETKPRCKKMPNVKKTDDKKRKRIRVFSDSEDSDAESPRERSPSPELEPDEPVRVDIQSDKEEEANVNPSSSEVASASHRRKKRKIVDKLVMTDEGYMETTKEVVFETDSGTDTESTKPPAAKKTSPEAEKKAPPMRAAPKKPVTPKKGKVSDGRKQASLLSFFKKT